jgi:hypothetical protein
VQVLGLGDVITAVYASPPPRPAFKNPSPSSLFCSLLQLSLFVTLLSLLYHSDISLNNNKFNMPAFNVTLKSGASTEELEKAKKTVTDQGGKIINEFTLVKGFTAEFPKDAVHSLESNDHVTVEADGEVTTQ